MKSLTVFSMAAALMLSAAPFALAQTSVTGTVGTSVDGATGNSTATGNAGANAGVSANNGGVDLSLDANGDGTVDAEEQAAGGQTNANASGGVDLTLDTNGDGTVSEEEAAAGPNSSSTEICSSVDLAAMQGDADKVAVATSAQVMKLTNCEDVSGSLSADVLGALTANTAIMSVLQQESVSAGEILGLNVEEMSVTIYVRDDDSEESSDDDAGAAVEGETSTTNAQ